MTADRRKRVAFYGGSYDPVHVGHMKIARRLVEHFGLDEFVFIPAYHAPHKRDSDPASPFHRFAMLSLVTADEERMKVSTIELDDPGHPYSIETLTTLKSEMPDDEIFFVIGADSWQDIKTWRRWEEVLTIVNTIVVTRPGFEIVLDHVTEAILERVVDLRGRESGDGRPEAADTTSIFITDAVNVDVSATEIRRLIREGSRAWKKMVPPEAAAYIEKYGLYR